MANLAELVPVVVQPDRNINAVLTPKPGYRVCIQILNHEYAVYYKHTDRRTDVHADCNTSLPYREWPGGVVAGRWTCAIMYQPWASCLHTCASVTKQYNLVAVKGR